MTTPVMWSRLATSLKAAVRVWVAMKTVLGCQTVAAPYA